MNHMKTFIYTIIGIVVVAIVAGFVIVGSPQNKRVRRLDERRVNDLSNIQWQIVNYWQRKEQLPDTLNALRDDLSGYQIPVDPETGETYGYAKTGDHSFKLCAAFREAVAADVPSYAKELPTQPLAGGGNWNHSAGYVCFERTIDPDLYKPVR